MTTKHGSSIGESEVGGSEFDGETIRVRFAPSPTGALHIGGARTAYFNWLYARKHKGTFVLRIDDTDTSRSTEESYQQILDSFRWLGLNWDEGPDVGGPYGPYRQSQRMSVYEESLARLVEDDKVYPCFCSTEQLQEDRELAQKEGRAPRYAGRCRDLSDAQRKAKLDAGTAFVYRFRSPAEGEVKIEDEIRGEVTFAAAEVDDFIVWKADGTPTYHFASCVDDAAMKITHIIRAEEHLSNTPRHVVLFEALSAQVPKFAHVPMILAPDRSKLSKRHGATSVQEYRDDGILPDALLNYLLLLGFSPGDGNDFVAADEAVNLFDLGKVTKHAAVYDVKKLEWLNALHVRNMNPDEIINRIWAQMQHRGWVTNSESRERLAWVRTVIQTVAQRARSLDDLVANMSYYFESVSEYDEKGEKKHFIKLGTVVADRLAKAADSLAEVQPFTVAALEQHYRKLISAWGIKGGELIHPTRLALSGMTVGPGLFDIMALLGQEECETRMENAAAYIRKQM
ncbi:glutamate--tRNA ligase [Alicyclobacillus sp. SO9]|uniref:glutamate--tRNA ligase n=1 Tax=Alicyclobacillus sp. SO9 TaxID=2665646 RepID=UPI0018E81769|nr:glutamate--tRNA ligase [Alicyclobacillus sp. SO9]QQE77043.1 glutamate--tRNA ligase [Alicyclobacillus sp. SO9]